MDTPIVDFIKKYSKSETKRLHMPGHKGYDYLGFEHMDITEIDGADALYEADGIIAHSEENASKLFGTFKTLYSTEGSSQCIRAMLYLALLNFKSRAVEGQGERNCGKPKIVAARNVHKSFIYAAALLDFDIVWMWPEDGNERGLCSCEISSEELDKKLSGMSETPAAVYITSPDYLGGQQNIREIAIVCHNHKTLLLVDNAHGAYLHFLEQSLHPIDLGADICCDSAHKTLPVLTGGAYLHISNPLLADEAKQALALFGSTSPSYLIMSSLDLCNEYLSDDYEQELKNTIDEINKVKYKLREQGWNIYDSDPLKLTIGATEFISGIDLADILRIHGIEPEFSDPDYLVLMITPSNKQTDFSLIPDILGKVSYYEGENEYISSVKEIPHASGEQVISIRNAIFSLHEIINVKDAKGRICGAPTVACPPAIPIAVSGEVIGDPEIRLFEYYGINEIEVVKELKNEY